MDDSSKSKDGTRDESSVGQQQDGTDRIRDSPQAPEHASKSNKGSEKFPNIPEKGDSNPKGEAINGPLGRRQIGQHNAESPWKREDSTKGKDESRKSVNSRKRGMVKFLKRFKTFGLTVKKLWDVWGRFKTQNNQDSNGTLSDRTLGVPGFEEIACIEAEVPDIMMMDKDRVRTSCKECMKDPPAFPSKEQVKAKLIAVDKYYGVNDRKSRDRSDTTLEHEADYYDVDGTVVRPSWRFILERPLVEQYVLMTNYIRKVSVISELKDKKRGTKYIEEEDSGSDTEYKNFEQKFIKERRELLKPILKPKTQEMAVQTSFVPEQINKEELKESVSEISLYPESQESTNSPEVSAVTIVTSRDYSSPLQSDFDGRATDRSASNREGNWWESPASCQPSESFQTSYDSVNNNVSSGSDGQSIPVHAVGGETSMRPTQGELSNEGDWIVTSSHKTGLETTTPKPKDPKRVSFSPVVTYYQGPGKNAAVYSLPEDHDKQDQYEQAPYAEAEIPLEDPMNTEPVIIKETQSHKTEKPRPPNMTLHNILQEKKSDQIVSVTLPEGWHKDRILHNRQRVNVSVSRTTTGNRQITKKISFQEYDEIPDLHHSGPQVSAVRDKTDTIIQTQVTQIATPSRHTKPTNTQRVHINTSYVQARESNNTIPSQNLELLNKNVNVTSRRNDHHFIDSVENGDNSQTAANRHVESRRISGTPMPVQPFDEPNKPLTPNRNTQNLPPQQKHFPITNNKSSENKKPIPWENFSSYHPLLQQSTHSNLDFKNEPQDVQPRTLSDPALTERLQPKKYSSDTSQKLLQVSTDTEGSSTSNDHIKLKPSPACFFKVATPTDLSKISVDDFYPNVPEIDAELSQNSERLMANTTQEGINFHQEDSALKCKQDTQFGCLRVTRKEENAILQTSTSPSRTIKATPRIEIKDVTGRNKSRSTGANKLPAMTGSQPRTVSLSHGRTAKVPQRDGSIVSEKVSRIDKALEREAMLEIGVKQILNTNEVRKNEMLKLKETNATTIMPSSNVPQKHKTKALKQPQIMAKVRGQLDGERRGENCGEQEIVGRPQKGQRKLLIDGGKETTMEDEQTAGNEIKQVDGQANITKSESESEIQRQFDVINDQENQLALGRAKNFMRTLSSLAEETSSLMESTSSSTAEKLIDIPAMARSVEELKTIFEKKPDTRSSILSDLGQNQSYSKHSRAPEGKFQASGSKGIPIEITGVEKSISSQSHTQSNEKCYIKNQDEYTGLTMGQSLTESAEKSEAFKSTTTNVPYGTVDNEKHARPGSIEDTNKYPSPLVHEESSTQQLSQIDIIRPFEIYSNTSMYFSTSEDGVAKYTKARTGFEPMTLDDEEASSACGKESKCLGSLFHNGSTVSNTIPSKTLAFEAKCTDVQGSDIQLDDKNQRQDHILDSKTKFLLDTGGDTCSLGNNNQHKTAENDMKKEPEETDKPSVNSAMPSSNVNEQNGSKKILANQQEKYEANTQDTSKPLETKQWLMDVIPMFSKHPQFHGFRPQNPVCMKDRAEAEALRNRQEAVKPVFKFLKRQREMEDNK